MIETLGALLLVAAQIGATAASESAPAPGYRPTTRYDTTEAGQYRTYRSEPLSSKSSVLLYFPKAFALVDWPLTAQSAPKAGTLLVRDETAGWGAAQSFPLQPERQAAGWRARFALPKGDWTVALLFPGAAPAFGHVDSRRGDVSLPPTALRPAARVVARFVDSRSNQPISTWKAFLNTAAGAPKTQEETFFAERPFGANTPALDFASLPTGSWKLLVDFAERGTRVQPLQVPAGERVIDLGSIPISIAGALAITVSFPEGSPASNLAVTLSEAPDAASRSKQGRPIATKRLEGARVRIADLVPGLATLTVVDEQGHEYYRTPTEIRAGQTTELTVALVPIVVSGMVSRNTSPIANARIEAKNGGQSFSGISAADGAYKITVWSPGFFFVLAFPEGSPIPVPSSIEIPEGAREYFHDVALPGASIFGTVVDAATRVGIQGADVEFSGGGEGSPSVSAAVQTSGNGEFRIENLTSDKVSLTASAKGYAEKTLADVLPSEGGTGLTFALTKETRAEGVVVDGVGSPIAGATVGVGLDGTGRFFRTETVTDSTGHFHFDDLDAGHYPLVAFRCGYKIAVTDIAIGDASEPPRVVLGNQTPLVIHLEDKRGLPIPGMALTFRVGTTPLPLEYPFRFLTGCGRPASTDGDGNSQADYLPLGALVAYDTAGTPLGAFANDGLHSLWSIRITRSPALRPAPMLDPRSGSTSVP